MGDRARDGGAGEAPGAPWPRPGGELARLIRERDWSGSPLGPLEGWPQSLRSAVGLLLRSRVAMVLLWGPEGVMIYNDAYSVFAGGRHPQLLGSNVREGWPEVADFNDRVMREGLAGGTLSFRDQELTLCRHGRPERVFMNLDYSPVEDEAGRPAGVLAVVVETTAQVLARRRDAFGLGLERRLRHLADPVRIMAEASEALGRELGLVRVGYGEIDAEAEHVVVERDWTDGRVGSVAGRWRLEDFGPGIIAELRAGRTLLVDDVTRDPRVGPAVATFAAMGTRAVLSVPLFREGRWIAGLYLHHAEPHAWDAGEVALAEEVMERTREAVERARAEARLRASEERFRLASLAVEGMVYDWDIATGRTERSEGLRRLLGFGPEEVPPTAEWWRERLHPEDLAGQGRKALRSALEDGHERYEVEYRVRHRDGRWVHVLDTGYVVQDGQGRALRIVGTTVDVTARRQAEAALRESEARLRALTDNLPVAMVYQVETSRDMAERRYLYVSGNCEKLTGVPADEATADPAALMSLIEPESLARVAEAERDASVRVGLLDIEMWARRRDGRRIAVHVFSRPREMPDGRLLWDGLLFDVTELREAERTLRLRAEELRAILDAVPAGIWITRDADAARIEGNARSHEFLRVPLGENQSQTASAGAPAHFRFLDGAGQPLPPDALPVQRAARGEEVRDTEYRVAFADGSHIDIFGNAVPLRDPAGRIAGAVAAFVDISARKRWEEHQRLLVNELNHRVKNTLATVQSIASRSLRAAASPEEARAALEGRLVALSRTHDLLTQASWESADIRDVALGALAPFRQERGDRVRMSGPSVRLPPRVALALAMALQELATNAAKYGALSDGPGRVELAWSVDAGESPPRLRLLWAESGGPPVEPPRRRGFGSRLIEKGLAQELDGEVFIDFAPGGVTCRIEAPLSRAPDPLGPAGAGGGSA